MSKQELIDAVALATRSTKAVTGEAIDAITKAVVKGETVQLSVLARLARANAPRVLAAILQRARRAASPRQRPSNSLRTGPFKDAVNSRQP